MKSNYGLNSFERDMTIKKLKHQQKYLFENGISANGVQIPYANFFKNAWHNSNRYIAELNHRIYSLNEYANEKGLSPIFAVITLPSEYHRLKTIKLKNGKLKLVNNPKYINDEDHSIKAGNKLLSNVIYKINYKRAFRNIPRDNRCYITTREPHLDGTPHLNLLYFVPKEKVKDCVKAIKDNFLDTHSRVETAINNPTAYIMKYIFKTLDDLRGNNDNLDNLSNLTLWYIHHKIPRVTMSRTFVSLDIYRALGGRYDIKTLTYMYKNKLLQVFIDSSNKVIEIFDDYGQIYNKKRYYKITPYLQKDKPILRSQTKSKFVPVVDNHGKTICYLHNQQIVYPTRYVNQMRDLELYDYFNSLDIDTCNLHHYALTNNELAKRDFRGFDEVDLNYFNTDFDPSDFEDAI